MSRSRPSAVPGPRVVVALLLLLGLVSVMLLDGYLRAEVGDDQRIRSGASADKVPDSVLDGGPLLSFPGGTARTQSVPDKTIVLTFDDGPDPEWTGKVLDVLDANDVPGTFFLVGSMISRYPSLVRDMVDGGNEVGIHTFTHVDLSYQGASRITRELAQTQLALAGAMRHHHDTVPRPVLVHERLHRQLQLARLREARRPRLHQRLHRHRQRGLAAAGRRQDHRPGHSEERQGRLRALPRLGRRSRADP